MKFLSKIELPANEPNDLLEALGSRLKDVARCNKKVIFLTISPNPSTSHEVSRFVKNTVKSKKYRVPYKLLTHEEQHAYLQKYIQRVYIDLLDSSDWLYYVFETNSDNNLHVHGFLFSNDLQDEYSIKMLQKNVYTNPMTVMNMARMKNGKSPKDYMNNLFYIDDSDKTKGILQKLEYIKKENSIKQYFPDCTFGFKTEIKDETVPPVKVIKKKNVSIEEFPSFSF